LLFVFYDGIQLTNKLNHLAVIFFDSDLPASFNHAFFAGHGPVIPTRGNPSVAPLFLFVVVPSRYIANGMYGFSCRRDNEFPVGSRQLRWTHSVDLGAKAVSAS
jgi:hypothetical protein